MPMRRIDTIIIGAGHAGLAVSRLLTDAGRDHVVLERGRVADAWRTQRWDSLRLLTPSWLSRLPSWTYRGADPHGFMRVGELAGHLDAYAASFAAPVHQGTTVLRVAAADRGYHVQTDQGTWRAAHVVVATGSFQRAAVPGFAAGLPAGVQQLDPLRYKGPRDVAPGRVLVVGGSSSGVQIADELAAAGREVLLAVGRHRRLPRTYRGHDILWWLDRAGLLDRTIDEVPDPAAARREPSMQLVGRADGHGVDLAALQSRGVRLVGRVLGADAGVLHLAGDLWRTIEDGDGRLARLLARLDRFATRAGLDAAVSPAHRPSPVRLTAPAAPTRLATGSIGAVVWATGFRPHRPWLHVPVLDGAGDLVQRRGATPAPGLYVVGQRFQHRRSSTFIDGARHDAADVVAAITRTRDTAELRAAG